MGRLDIRQQAYLKERWPIAMAGTIGIWCTIPSFDMNLIALTLLVSLRVCVLLISPLDFPYQLTGN